MDPFITSLYGVRGLTPSFFELLAQDKLLLGLRPAVKFVIQVISNRYPLWSPYLTRWEVVYWLALAALEWHYLTHYQSSFSERFYQLRREVVIDPPPLLRWPGKGTTSNKGGRDAPLRYVDNQRKLKAHQLQYGDRLPLRHRLASLAVLILVPLIRSAMEEYVLQWRFVVRPPPEPSAPSPPQPPRSRPHASSDPLVASIRSHVATIHRIASERIAKLRPSVDAALPYVYGFHEGVLAGYALLYLLDPHRWPFWSPYLQAMGLVLRSHPDPPPSESKEPMSRAALVQEAISWSLFAGISALRLLEWWYETEAQLQPHDAADPPPPPPSAPLLIATRQHKGSGQSDSLSSGAPPPPPPPLPQDPRLCPLCHQPRQNPGSESGREKTGLWSCGFLRQHGCCPLTGIKMSEQEMRRLFE
ncbi:unnamed protein product [Vitrella brassicaformis CCMP3155]|uniref:Pex N-terminal domain-containing protein n=1 Tax=Vitrella brassicaformis (strain CCMP3155) TaxID=1169540 RepID=A0A0G4G2L5_VITBC|nr:unnamed protein product [Vitrella brassicaformis CCMP3155]|eukprot:CEM21924.1 unnamed protein product [Vitrella brassicaformis CCMP3155]